MRGNDKETAILSIIHSLEDALRVLAEPSDTPPVLQSAPGAARFIGVEALLAIAKEARSRMPERPFRFRIDCGDDAGMAMLALRLGTEEILFTGPKTVAEKLEFSVDPQHQARIVPAG